MEQDTAFGITEDKDHKDEFVQKKLETSPKVDWFRRHSQLRQRHLDRMTNADRLSPKSPEISPRFVRRSFDMHMLRPQTDIFDGSTRSLSDSELERQNDSNLTAEFMDLPKRLSKRLSLHSRRSYEADIRQNTLSSRRAEISTSRSDLPPSSVPKIEFSNIHVVVEDIDPDRPNVSGFFIGEPSYSSESDDFLSTGSRLWMNLEPQSHALLSPRSSNGSICSYRSSNADSAIEILTPDEEIPEHSPSESADSRFWDNRLLDNHPPSVNITETFHTHVSSGDVVSTTHTSVTLQTSQSVLDNTITSHSVSLQLISSDTLYHSHSDSQLGHLSLRSSYGDFHRSSHLSETQSDTFISSCDISKREISASSVKESSFTQLTTENVQNTSVPSILPPSLSKGKSFLPDPGYSQQGRSLPSSSPNVAQGTPLPIPPVVISDFSNRARLESKTSQSGNSEDTGSYLSCVPDKTWKVSRSLSNCSISSNESSTFSIQSDSSLDVEEPIFTRPKDSVNTLENIYVHPQNSQISKQVHPVRTGQAIKVNMDEINNQYLPQQNQSSGTDCPTQDLCIEVIKELSINRTDSENGNTNSNTRDLVDLTNPSFPSEISISNTEVTGVGQNLCEETVNVGDPVDYCENTLNRSNEDSDHRSVTSICAGSMDAMMVNKVSEKTDDQASGPTGLPNKVRKLDEGAGTGNGAKSQGCKRALGGAVDSDNAKLMDGDKVMVEDDDFDTDLDYGSETDEPCECDACILDVEQDTVDQKPSRKPPTRTSSWKKIRNIVHWSPFIQQFKRRKYPWIQLAGHQGNFQAGEPGAILKKYDKREYAAFKKLMKDVLRSYVPEYRGETAKDGERYVQQQDLLCEFEAPCVMDIKMGCRTYLEEELVKARENPTLRKDMYQKMVEVDPNAPTEEEHNQKAITKPRYMQWRDDMSSSSEMGFRIEGIRKSDGAQVKNFKKTKDKNSVKECLKLFVEENPVVVSTYLRRLKAIRATQEVSPFFKSHEIIGSSLLFVHDRGGQASIWMIDFGKTVPLPENVSVSHRNKWEEGNHEDGYLYGMDSLIEIFDELNTEYCKGETNISEKCDKVDTQVQSDTRPPQQKDSIEITNVTTDSEQLGRLKDDGQSSTV